MNNPCAQVRCEITASRAAGTGSATRAPDQTLRTPAGPTPKCRLERPGGNDPSEGRSSNRPFFFLGNKFGPKGSVTQRAKGQRTEHGYTENFSVYPWTEGQRRIYRLQRSALLSQQHRSLARYIRQQLDLACHPGAWL